MVIAAARVVMLGIAPVGRLDGIGPQANRRRVVIEPVAGDRVVLAVFGRHAGAIALEIVAANLRLVTISRPHAVLASPGALGEYLVAAERRLDAVRRGVADVVAVKQVVVRPAGPRIHRRLPRPQEHSIAAM